MNLGDRDPDRVLRILDPPETMGIMLFERFRPRGGLCRKRGTFRHAEFLTSYAGLNRIRFDGLRLIQSDLNP